jgi:murein DD-endopeptidase MepM/ murein hydrolase activator NlpD
VTRGRLQRLLLLGLCGATAVSATEVVWPTSMDRAQLRGPEDYLQPTESKRLESGGFGMVRDDGHRFHEGLDIRPVGRNKAGDPTDLVFSAMEGVVAYVNPRANGAYGRYVVLVHPRAEIPVYTLYAHLASLQPELKPGLALGAGKVLGVMGHSSTGETAIPKERAHLHFEVGVILSEKFQAWYDADEDNAAVAAATDDDDDEDDDEDEDDEDDEGAARGNAVGTTDMSSNADITVLMNVPGNA